MAKIQIFPANKRLITSYYKPSLSEVNGYSAIDVKKFSEDQVLRGVLDELKKRDIVKCEAGHSGQIYSTKLYVLTPEEMEEFVQGILDRTLNR